MDFENNSWIWEGVYHYPHLFGGIMLTAAVLGLSTSFFGGISVPSSLAYFWPDLGIFHKRKHGKKRIRVYMDGCFDLMHYGHANALRQAKALGDELVVGVVSDEEIIANKGPPVLSMEERYVSLQIFLAYICVVYCPKPHITMPSLFLNISIVVWWFSSLILVPFFTISHRIEFSSYLLHM